jgi:hypothetical protein
MPKDQLRLTERLLNLPHLLAMNAGIAEREMTIQVETADEPLTNRLNTFAICAARFR